MSKNGTKTMNFGSSFYISISLLSTAIILNLILYRNTAHDAAKEHGSFKLQVQGKGKFVFVVCGCISSRNSI
jgi:hypothetical protein